MTHDPGTGELAVEDRFSIVPEWLLDADISDRAVRLYALLLRYGSTSGARVPGRATLARRLRCSVDSLDRAVDDLERIGALEVGRDASTIEHRRAEGRGYANNRYYVRTSKPQRHGRPDDPQDTTTDPGTVGTSTPDRTSKPQRHGRPISTETGADLAACTRPPSRVHAATPSRVHAATCTESVLPIEPQPHPPAPRPTPADRSGQRATASQREAAADWRAIFDTNRDLDEFCSELRVLRREQDLAATRWTGQAIRRAIVLAVAAGYEPRIVPAALRAMAIDPATELPGRLAHAGPWWDVAETHDLTRRRDAKAAAVLEHDRRLAAARAACDCEFGWRSVVVDGHETTRRCTTCRPTTVDAPTRRSHSA